MVGHLILGGSYDLMTWDTTRYTDWQKVLMGLVVLVQHTDWQETLMDKGFSAVNFIDKILMACENCFILL